MAITLARHLYHAYVRGEITDSSLIALIKTIADTSIGISQAVRQGALAGLLGTAGKHNIQGEIQQKLDIYANQTILTESECCNSLVAMASEEMELPYTVSHASDTGSYLLLFDPLDGSSNIAVNGPIGSIFSILRQPHTGTLPTEADFLQPGRQQVAACYALYGPQTMFVLSTGCGVTGFTLDTHTSRFICTHPMITIPTSTNEFAINMSNQRHWEKPVQGYINELLAGKTGKRHKDFNMRWVASMVADVHRILMRGGIFAYPRDHRSDMPGKLRLLYEANPMAFLIEQAGGSAHDGHQRILDIQPTKLHQRVAVFLGAQAEVDRILNHHIHLEH